MRKNKKISSARLWNNSHKLKFAMYNTLFGMHCDMDNNYPITSYIDKVRGCWDGHDHIADLASCVKTTCRQWPQWLRRWLLAMVAQWTGRNKDYGNAMAPLLISEQGYGKSTFCKAIIPKELSWGYIDNIVMAEKKQVLCAMTEMLLINLDEFNQISPSL